MQALYTANYVWVRTKSRTHLLTEANLVSLFEHSKFATNYSFAEITDFIKKETDIFFVAVSL